MSDAPRKSVPFLEQAGRNYAAISLLVEHYRPIEDEVDGGTFTFQDYFMNIEMLLMGNDLAHELGLPLTNDMQMLAEGLTEEKPAPKAANDDTGDGADGEETEEQADLIDPTNDTAGIHSAYPDDTAFNEYVQPMRLEPSSMVFWPSRLKTNLDYVISVDTRVIHQMIQDYEDRGIALPEKMVQEKFDLKQIAIERFDRNAFEALKNKELDNKETVWFMAVEQMLYDADKYRAEVNTDEEWRNIVDLTPVYKNDN